MESEGLNVQLSFFLVKLILNTSLLLHITLGHAYPQGSFPTY